MYTPKTREELKASINDEAFCKANNPKDWDVSLITDFSYLFEGVKSFDWDVSQWQTSQVTKADGLFAHSEVQTDINGWDLSGVLTMSRAFAECTYNRELMLNTFKCRDFTGLFQGNRSFNSGLLMMTHNCNRFDYMFNDTTFGTQKGSYNVNTHAFNKRGLHLTTYNGRSMKAMFAFSEFNLPLITIQDTEEIEALEAVKESVDRRQKIGTYWDTSMFVSESEAICEAYFAKLQAAAEQTRKAKERISAKEAANVKETFVYKKAIDSAAEFLNKMGALKVKTNYESVNCSLSSLSRGSIAIMA